MAQMISSRIIRISAVALVVFTTIALISMCRRQREPVPDSSPVDVAQISEGEGRADGEVADFLSASQVSAESMISRPRVAVDQTGPVKDEAAREPEISPSGVSVNIEPEPKTVPSPVTQIAHRYVQPSAMVSLLEKDTSATNVNSGETLGVDLLADERGISEMMAKSYIRKSAMLSKESDNFSAGWITYAKREKSSGFIIDQEFVDDVDVKINIPGLQVDNPDVLARAMYYIREAEIKMKEGDNEQAMTLYTQALAVYPSMTYANKQLGRLSLLRGEYDNAIRFLKNALDADETLSETLNELGTAYLYAGQSEEALRTFSASHEASPLSLDPLFNIGLALRTLNRRDEARATFEEYLEADKFDARVYRELAVIDLQEGNQDEALSRLHTAIALDSRWYTPQLDAAIIYAEKGAYVKALELLEKALEYAPVWVVYKVYNLPALQEARLIPESRALESALVEKVRNRM